MTFCPTHKMQWTDDDIVHKQHQKEFPSCNDYKNDDKLQKLQSKNSNSLSKSELKIKGKLGNLFVESVWIDEKPAFLCINLDSGEILSQSNVIHDGIKYIPPQRESDIPYEKYSFSSKEVKQLNNQKISKQELLDEIKILANHYIVNFPIAQTLTTVDVLLSHCMDWIDLIHYPFYVGDTGSGKSANAHFFKWLSYRPLYSEDITTANIYQYLGETDEGQGTIIEDEAQDLGEQREKIKIYKNGYSRGSKIPRITNSDSTRNQKFYYTFGLKVFCGEKIPNDKGLLERLVIIKMIEGRPKGNIKKPTSDEKIQLRQLRKRLLVWKLQTQIIGLPEQIKTDLVNRDEELWYDFLRIASDTTFYEPAQKVVNYFVKQRHENIENSLEAKLFRCIVYNLDENMELNIMKFWEWLLSDQNTILTGNDNGRQSIILDEFQDTLSIHTISGLIRDKFHGMRFPKTSKGDDGKYHEITFYKFEAINCKKFVDKYGIEIPSLDHPIYKGLEGLEGRRSDPSDPSDPFCEHVLMYRRRNNHEN